MGQGNSHLTIMFTIAYVVFLFSVLVAWKIDNKEVYPWALFVIFAYTLYLGGVIHVAWWTLGMAVSTLWILRSIRRVGPEYDREVLASMPIMAYRLRKGEKASRGYAHG